MVDHRGDPVDLRLMTCMLCLLVSLPLVSASFATITGTGFGDPETLATFAKNSDAEDNGIVVGATLTQVEDGASFSQTIYAPADYERFTFTGGTILIFFDETRNAIENVTISTLDSQPKNNRSFFVNIGDINVAIDPLNSSFCLSDSTDYICEIGFNYTGALTPTGLLLQEDLSTSSTQHDRIFTVLHQLDDAQSLTKLEEITTFFFEASKTIVLMIVDLFVAIYYFLLITFGIVGIGIIVLILRAIYRAIIRLGDPGQGGEM